jgi:hypothetical protein
MTKSAYRSLNRGRHTGEVLDSVCLIEVALPRKLTIKWKSVANAACHQHMMMTTTMVVVMMMHVWAMGESAHLQSGVRAS